jgi:hypothetical protein
VPVVLKTGRPQAGNAVILDEALPGKELFDGEIVPSAGILEAEEPMPDRCHDLCLAPADPALRFGRGKIFER